jgi:putative endonuclease
MYYVYILKSQKIDWIYIGYTENIERRFVEHQQGLSIATKPYAPFELVFYEAYKAKADAKRREDYFKTTKGKRALRLLLQKSLE